MNKVTVKINGVSVTVPVGTTILDAAYKAGFEIPTLCYMRGVSEIGSCRVCVVELVGSRTPVASCVYRCDRDGMEIYTNTPKIIEYRRKTLELMVSNHKKECLSCVRSGDCELMRLCHHYDVQENNRYEGEMTPSEPDTSPPHMIKDTGKCILCRRCVAICAAGQGINAIGPNNRGFKTEIGSPFKMHLDRTACVSCGQCIAVCPTGALKEKSSTDEVMAAIDDPTKTVIIQTAPAVRAAIGECFKMPAGTNTQGKLVASLRRLGFDYVFDTNFGADLTVMEEATELMERVKNGGPLPLMTSCSPAWVKYCETYFPEFIPNLSTCKSPQQMFGAIAKTWWAKKMGIDPKNLVVVSAMPCTAKKFELTRDGEAAAGVPDVDYAITTRGIATMISMAGIRFSELPDEEYDDPLGFSSGAGAIFGSSGGVAEASLRTAYEMLTGRESPTPNFIEMRGVGGTKRAQYDIDGMQLRVAVTSGLANARRLLEAVRDGKENYHMIEVMACPGGCVNGGGQPQVMHGARHYTEVRSKRASVLYNIDENKSVRTAHENDAVQQLYDEFLGSPGSELCHELLHTHFVDRSDLYK
ncbi:MAG: [FeFe] hydrogenase, group A [Oscillospiraceae bacterium]|nr:[FeFe] hydrogenase, group A [Oscillospiraceae bacterium]